MVMDSKEHEESLRGTFVIGDNTEETHEELEMVSETKEHNESPRETLVIGGTSKETHDGLEMTDKAVECVKHRYEESPREFLVKN